jgi:hypothetical protein
LCSDLSVDRRQVGAEHQLINVGQVVSFQQNMFDLYPSILQVRCVTSAELPK